MFTFRLAQQGRGNENAVIDALRTGAATAGFNRMRAAYAYATAGGVVELVGALSAAMSNWPLVKKRWLVSMDWGHTEPLALQLLASLDNSEVRVPYALEVLANRLDPRTCFHSKTLVLDRADRSDSPPVVIAIGSANLTVSGLRTGHEDVAVAAWTGGRLRTAERAQLVAMQAEATRFDQVWRKSIRLTPALVRTYASLRPKRKPRSEDVSRRVLEIEGSLEAEYARIAALRAATGLWIEIRYVVSNLGAGRPGNQIDMQRGTRVFFGFPADRIPPNTGIGSIEVGFATKSTTRNLRFGNNSMDKLDLPIPGVDGPPTYEDKVLMFRRAGMAAFDLRVGSPADVVRWKRSSRNAGTLFRMSSGREWGGRSVVRPLRSAGLRAL